MDRTALGIVALLSLLGCSSGGSSDSGAPPTYWSAEATVTIDDQEYVRVAGEKFFALGMHANAGLIYDGLTTEGCDQDAGVGFLPPGTNIEQHHLAAAAGANYVYLWGYGDGVDELIDVTPRFHGKFYSGYGVDRPVEDDVVPVMYNRYGEVDMDGDSDEKVAEMRAEQEHFSDRTGPYSPESMPNLPPVEQVGHLAWHPTFRMEGGGDGSGEMLTDEEATALARTTNMMIGDSYAYVENRFDRSTPEGELMAQLVGQKGDIGEGYEEWLAADDPEHRGYFTAGWDLAHSIVTRRNPGTVVWMWIQGYSFGRGIARANCRGESTDAWAAGGFPPLRYLKKEVLSTIAAGSTGIVFFGYPSALPEDKEKMHAVFRALSHPEVYGPALLAPRLDLGVDLASAGEDGCAHLMVRWDEDERQALVVAANPGAHATAVEVDFPWSVDTVEVLADWEGAPGFAPAAGVEVDDLTLRFTLPVDSGEIYRVTPVLAPESA